MASRVASWGVFAWSALTCLPLGVFVHAKVVGLERISEDGEPSEDGQAILPGRGDVVLTLRPLPAAIKRIQEGVTVVFSNTDTGQVATGVVACEPSNYMITGDGSMGMRLLVVPPNHYCLTQSLDPTGNHFVIHASLLRGTATAVVWPPSHMRILPPPVRETRALK